jgi:hypothetical protein
MVSCSQHKIGVFLKKQCYDKIFTKSSKSLSKKASFFAKFLGENIFKIITSVPVRLAVPYYGAIDFK